MGTGNATATGPVLERTQDGRVLLHNVTPTARFTGELVAQLLGWGNDTPEPAQPTDRCRVRAMELEIAGDNLRAMYWLHDYDPTSDSWHATLTATLP